MNGRMDDLLLRGRPEHDDPRRWLSASEKRALRLLRLRPFLRVRAGWSAAGNRITLKVSRRLEAMSMARAEFVNGQHRLALTPAGRSAIERADAPR